MSLLRSLFSLRSMVAPAGLALAATLAGCTAIVGYGTDGGTPDGGPSRPPRHLAFEGTTGTQTLRPGERLTFTVRYAEDDGSAVPAAPVTFALVGSSHDSSLASTAATTDGAGHASGTLVAGLANGAYEIRASADRATPAHLDVAVSDAGFGSLRVTLRYAGSRGLASRTVGVAGGAHCADAVAASALDRVVPVPTGAAAVTVDALPAGTAYAVVARGLAADGRVLSEGCVEGTSVAADATAAASVEMADLPPQLSGPYDVALVVDAETSALAVAHAVTAAETTTLAGAADATFYLDALEAHLRASGQVAAAVALGHARGTAGLDASLATALGTSGPTLAAGTLALRLAGGTRGLVLGGVLTAPPDGTVPNGALTLTDVLTSGLVDLSPTPARLAMGGSSLRAPVATLDARLDRASGTLELRQVVVQLPLGMTSLAVLGARRSLAGVSTTAELLSADAGCDLLASWGGAQADVATVCDASCLRATCGEALVDVGTAVETALATLDSTRGALALVGVALLLDANDDGIADGVGPATLAGTWGTGTTADGDAVIVRLEGVRE